MKKMISAAVVATTVLMMTAPAQAATIFNLTSQNVSGVTTSGTITTDGTIGTLNGSNILGYNITLSQTGSADEVLSSGSTTFKLIGNYLSASATNLFWNYAQGVGAEFSVAPSNATQYHLYTNRTDVNFNGIEHALYLSGVQSVGTAVAPAVPEPATWAMMILGMSAVGYAIRRKTRLSDAKFDAHIKAVTYGAAA